MNRILAVLVVVLMGLGPSLRAEEELFTHVYVVPPGFLHRDGNGSCGWQPRTEALEDRYQPKERLAAKAVLERAGIVFPAGGSAIYNPKTSQLTVRNTQGQLELVEAYIESTVAKVEKQIYVSVREAGFQGELSEWMKKHSGWTPGDPEIEAKLLGLFEFPDGDQAGQGYSFGSYESFKEELARPPKSMEEGRAKRRVRMAGALTDSEFQMLVRWLSQMKEIEFHSLPSVMARSRQPVITQAEQRRYGVVPVLGADEFTLDLDLFLPEHGKALWDGNSPVLKPTVSATVWDGITVVVAEKNPDGRNRLVFVTAQLMDPAGMPVRKKTEKTPPEEAAIGPPKDGL